MHLVKGILVYVVEGRWGKVEGAVVRLVNAPGRWRGVAITSKAVMPRDEGVLPIVLWGLWLVQEAPQGEGKGEAKLVQETPQGEGEASPGGSPGRRRRHAQGEGGDAPRAKAKAKLVQEAPQSEGAPSIVLWLVQDPPASASGRRCGGGDERDGGGVEDLPTSGHTGQPEALLFGGVPGWGTCSVTRRVSSKIAAAAGSITFGLIYLNFAFLLTSFCPKIAKWRQNCHFWSHWVLVYAPRPPNDVSRGGLAAAETRGCEVAGLWPHSCSLSFPEILPSLLSVFSFSFSF